MVMMPPGRLPLEVFRAHPSVKRPRAYPGLAGGIICPFWPENASGSPRRSWRVLLGRDMSIFLSWTCCLRDPTSERMKIGGWMEYQKANEIAY